MHVLLQYQSKRYYIIGQEVYYSIGRFITLSGSYYIIGRFLLHYRAVITVSGVYYIIGWYNPSCNVCAHLKANMSKEKKITRGSSVVDPSDLEQPKISAEFNEFVSSAFNKIGVKMDKCHYGAAGVGRQA